VARRWTFSALGVGPETAEDPEVEVLDPTLGARELLELWGLEPAL
jgi:hypothetical protein